MFHEYNVPNNQACEPGMTYSMDVLPDSLLFTPCDQFNSLSASDILRKIDNQFREWSSPADTYRAPVIFNEDGGFKVYTEVNGNVSLLVDMADGKTFQLDMSPDELHSIINTKSQEVIPVAPVNLQSSPDKSKKQKKPIDPADIFGVVTAIVGIGAFVKFLKSSQKEDDERTLERIEEREEKEERIRRHLERSRKEKAEDDRARILYNGFNSVNSRLSVLQEEVRRRVSDIQHAPSYNRDCIPGWKNEIVDMSIKIAKLNLVNQERERLVTKHTEEDILQVEVELPDEVVRGIVENVRGISGSTNTDSLGWLYDINRTVRAGWAVDNELTRKKRRSNKR